MVDNTQYLSQDKCDALEAELKELKTKKIPEIATRIDEAKQLGDLSENAEYHDARDQMAWTQSRVKEIEFILANAQIITSGENVSGVVSIGSTVVVKVNGKEKEYTIVGAQEADPISGKISNESPLGDAFMGKKKGNKVQVEVPAGVQEYKIIALK
jgi:transcription elongation factor GreA